MTELVEFEALIAARLERRARVASRPFDPATILERAVLDGSRSRGWHGGSFGVAPMRVIAAGVGVLVVALGALAIGTLGPSPSPSPSPSAGIVGQPTPVGTGPCRTQVPTNAPGESQRAAFPWPNARGDSGPGRYAWFPGSKTWMHKVSNGIGVQLSFARESTPLPGATATTTEIAGTQAERRERVVPGTLDRQVEWILVGPDGYTIHVTLTIAPESSEETIAEGFALIESLRFEPSEFGCGWMLSFDTLGGWDSG